MKKLSKKTLNKSFFSWFYGNLTCFSQEHMQTFGYLCAMLPVVEELYDKKEDQKKAMQTYTAFFNTEPQIGSLVVGMTAGMEEAKANGQPIDGDAINGIRAGLMGPLAGIGDPVFWFTLRPILGAMCASIAMDGNMLGPILFFLLWNIIRLGFLWYTQEFGYKVGGQITENMSGKLLENITRGASILGMFVLGALVQRWVSIKFAPVVSSIQLSKGAYIEWDQLPAGGEGIKMALQQVASGMSLEPVKVTTLQNNLDALIPGLTPLLLTLLCMWLLKKGVSPIIIIIALFAVGIVGHLIGLL